MKQTIQITTLKPKDWQAYKKLRLEALLTESEAFASSYEEQVKMQDEYWQKRLEDAENGDDNWLLFAKNEDSTLVGMVGAFAKEDTGIAEIISLYVTPGARGKGIAKELVQEILKKVSKNKAVKKVTLSVRTTQDAALSLYRQLGFEIVGKDEKNVEYLMEKLLK